MLPADIPFDLYSRAVPVLVLRWVLVGAGVTGVGSALPWVLRRAGAPLAPRQRQVFSLAAVAFCLLAIPLLLDTYKIEAQAPDAFTALQCMPSGSAWACEDGSSRVLPAAAGEPRQGVLYQLRYTGAFVAYQAAP